MESSPNMLTKFESKSSRAKGIAFHSRRPWILVSLHTSTIQLWDYRMGTLIDRFEEHDGPVRGIDFHKTQPLFVSGGDDYKIKVWSYQTRRCLFTLNGHLDYVRTVFFHHESPWILSASDDQTIRIWNWQNRSLICTMTGHNHYAMCAQFHPREDLVVSASLDQSVRVWDISGLRKKHSAAPQMSFEDQMARQNAGQADVFGNSDAVVKFVLEGHDRGVNWATFHPTLPLIVSAGDDRLIKLWRMNDTKAWEVDTCRGHFQNACAALFHPHQDLILSVGEDKTVRVWDLNKRTAVKSFKRENDRFWVIAAHPEMNLFAAGHDNGVMVFKLERERPASAVHQNSLYYVTRDKQVRCFDLTKSVDSPPLLSLKRLGPSWIPPRSISYNPAERSVLVTSSADGGTYELSTLPRDGSGVADPNDAKRGLGSSAVFVARNRFAVFNPAHSQIDIKDLTNSVTKSFGAPSGCTDIFPAGPGNLLLVTPTNIVLYDIQQKKNLAELAVSGVKYLVWSNDSSHAALLSKHNVTIVKKNLEQVSTLHETIRIKSAAWDDSGVLLYSTLNHIKYTLLNGDNGIVRTLDQTVYLVKVKGRAVFCLDRYARPKTLSIDPTEYRFKMALVRRDYDEMLHMIKTASLPGQSIIAYLQKKGYSEIALQFVEDPLTRFELALECGNLDVARETASQLDRPQLWSRLSAEALAHGNHQIAEVAYQRTRNFDKLSFLYLSTGNKVKLEKMADIASKRNDYISEYQNAMYLGDIPTQIRILRELEQYSLAYSLAKTHGLDELTAKILEGSGIDESHLFSLSASHRPIKLPTPVATTYQRNWPISQPSGTSFQQLLAASTDGTVADIDRDLSVLDVGGDAEQGKANGLMVDDENEDDADAWGVVEDNALPEPDETQPEAVQGNAPGPSEAEGWSRNSPIAANHVAEGSFETAMQLLNRQLGAVNFEPLKSRFMEVYAASRTQLPGFPGLDPLVNYVRRNPEAEVTPAKPSQPFIPRDLDYLASEALEKGYSAFQKNDLGSAQQIFQDILHALMVNAAARQSQVTEAQELITTARDYVLALSIELSRRTLEKDPAQQKRNLELAAYFTIPSLQPAHRALALWNAMKLARDAKNYSSALIFANRIIESGAAKPKVAEQARNTKSYCERNSGDLVEIDFEGYAEFGICGRSFTPLYGGAETKACPFDGQVYHAKFKGMVCKVCGVCEIGATASGLRLFA